MARVARATCSSAGTTRGTNASVLAVAKVLRKSRRSIGIALLLLKRRFGLHRAQTRNSTPEARTNASTDGPELKRKDPHLEWV